MVWQYGTAGGSVRAGHRTGWTTSARAAAGRAGETAGAVRLTATFADRDDVYLFHDLQVPGTAANADHVLVAGRDILVVDTKRWRSGLYWTVAGRTRRGTDRAEHCDVDISWIADRLATWLAAQHTDVRPTRDLRWTSALLVVPQGPDPMRMWAYRPAGRNVRVVVDSRPGTVRQLRRMLRGDGPPRGWVLRALHGLTIDPQTVVPHQGRR